MKAPLFAAFFALLVLVACSAPESTTVEPRLDISQRETAKPTENALGPTTEADQSQDSTRVAIPSVTKIPATAPGPTPAAGPVPTTTPRPTPTQMPIPTGTATPMLTPTQTPTQASIIWRGITVASEHRCSPYDPDDYPYSPSVEPRIVDELGGVYGPYTGLWFGTIRETDIEHMVARSEAHDSGLCAADSATRSRFASDLLNLTLASPSVNRHQKSDKDVAEWLPDLNRCWYVDRVVQVRQKYGLSIDRAEANAIDEILADCQSTSLVVLAPEDTTSPTTPAAPTPGPDVDPLALWDDNGNGRITCAEARAHGIAPVRRGHPAYQHMNDADDDGVVCE